MPKASQKISSSSLAVFRPQDLVAQFGIESGMQVADFGSGAGDFAILLAKIVGKEGIVYAIDVQEGPIQSVQSRAKFFGLNNIRAIRSNLENSRGSTLDDASQDAVLTANILFQSKNREAIIQEAVRILKGQGMFIVVEWRSDVPLGPHASMRMSRDELVAVVEKQGLHLAKEFEAGSFHFGLIFKRATSQ